MAAQLDIPALYFFMLEFFHEPEMLKLKGFVFLYFVTKFTASLYTVNDFEIL